MWKGIFRQSLCLSECGCSTEYSVDSNNATSDSDGFVEQDSIVEDETEESTTNISDTVKDFAGKALASWNDRNHATSKVNVIKVDEQHRTFKLKDMFQNIRVPVLEKL